MKKYLFFVVIALLSFACSKSDHHVTQKKAEETVKSYLKNKVAEADSYEAIAFGKLDSLQLKDTKVYKEYEVEKNRLEISIASLKQRMKSLEDSGVNKSEQLYTDLNDRLNDEEAKLKKVDEQLKKLENKGKDSVYSIEHRFKARKTRENVIMTYDDVFYIDKNGNVIEEVAYIY